jgi:hypothetical protein
LLCTACGAATWPATLHDPDAPYPTAADSAAFLKVHTRSGDLYVLESWTVPGTSEDLVGTGWRYDPARIQQAYGPMEIAREEIVLLETNRKAVVGRFAFGGLTVLSTLMGLTTVACLADPKSCFGSCPTFYTVDDPDRPLAEGFSSSFARRLEERDVDRLGVRGREGAFSLVMRNEAQETHAVRHVKLLAAPVPEGGTVLLDGSGSLVAASPVRPPRACASEGGDCLEEVRVRDDVEYAPLTDGRDLAAREEVVVDFGEVNGRAGLVLSARHSLVTTYLFYQSLAYAGSRVGDLLASLERGDPGVEDRALALARELGPIEVLLSLDGGPWEAVGAFDEAGPIAADQRVVDLGPARGRDVRVLLRMAKGSWRIDEIGLAELGEPVLPTTIEPDSVTAEGTSDPLALERLGDPGQHLVTVPGDEYRIWFTLPQGGEHELFLDSQGYYYEWVREEWLLEESALDVATVMSSPREALRRLAPAFKAAEPEMERLFWASRFRRGR